MPFDKNCFLIFSDFELWNVLKLLVHLPEEPLCWFYRPNSPGKFGFVPIRALRVLEICRVCVMIFEPGIGSPHSYRLGTGL